LKEKNTIFIEIGAGRILGMMVRTHPDKKPGHMVLNTVKHQQEKVSDDYFLLEKIGQLWRCGQPIDWTEFYKEEKRYRLPLPGYPFEGKRYWIDAQANVFKPGVEPSPALESLQTPEPPGESHESPRSELEQAIVQVWQEFLGIEPIGIHDNFFQLNGNSLIAVQLIGRLNEEYQVEIPMSHFYEEPTIAHLAAVINELKLK
jgi:acyl transferase domain-containing protein